MIRKLRERKPPIVFLLLAAFHILWAVYDSWSFFQVPPDLSLPGEWGYLTDVITVLLLAICWFQVTYLRKWAAYAYIGVFASSALLHHYSTLFSNHSLSLPPMFPVDLLSCVVVVIFFKRLS